MRTESVSYSLVIHHQTTFSLREWVWYALLPQSARTPPLLDSWSARHLELQIPPNTTV